MASLDEIGNYLESVTALLKTAMLRYKDSQLALNKQFLEIKKPIVHMHAVHAHPCCHSYDGRTDQKNYNDPLFKKCEQKCFETKFYPDDWPTPVEMLIREISTEQDCDNNGLIFLKHFIFNPSDKQVPKIVHAMQRIELKNMVIPRYNWKDYLSTVSNYLYLY